MKVVADAHPRTHAYDTRACKYLATRSCVQILALISLLSIQNNKTQSVKPVSLIKSCIEAKSQNLSI